jgi:hypothetical protein
LNIQHYVPGWNIVDYLPPLFAIYLIFISSFPSGALDSLLKLQLRGNVTLEQRTFIKNVALEWGTRVSFVTSIIAAVISVLVTFSDTQSYTWAALLIFLILTVYLPMSIRILEYKMGDMLTLARTEIWKRRFLHKSPAYVYDMTLILVNSLLLIAVFVSQLLAT